MVLLLAVINRLIYKQEFLLYDILVTALSYVSILLIMDLILRFNMCKRGENCVMI